MRQTLALLVILLAPSLAAAPKQNLRDTVRAWRLRSEAAIVTELRELLAIPNVATDTPNIERNAAAIAEMLRRRGIEPRLLRVEGAPPVVFGEVKTPGAKETLVLYSHYDGQPVDRARWATDPWTPVIRTDSIERSGKLIEWSAALQKLDPEWRILARSASDDKAPIVAMLAALDALRAARIPLRTNVKFFFEGEEEAGSPHLARILEKHRDLLDADLWIIADGPVHQSGRLQLYYGVRGIIGLELTTYGAVRPLHSGHYGNWAPNPLMTMTHLLASMRDEEGRILIDRFYDDVRPLTQAERAAIAEVPPVDEQLRRELAVAQTGGAPIVERITAPALNIRGIRGGGVGETAANAISTEAVASIDFRLVPDQTPERIREMVEAHVRRRGFHIVREEPDADARRTHAKILKVEWESGYPAARVPLDHPVARVIEQRIEATLDEQLVKLPTLGGSIPLHLFQQLLGVPALGLPIVNHDNNQHGANESLRLQNLWTGIEVFAAVMAGESPPPRRRR